MTRRITLMTTEQRKNKYFTEKSAKSYAKTHNNAMDVRAKQPLCGHVTEKMFDERKNKLKFQMCNLNQ